MLRLSESYFATRRWSIRTDGGSALAAAQCTHVLIIGSNLTSTKARLLLFACLMKCDAMPVAADPSNPAKVETEAAMKVAAKYQDIFDTH